VLLLSQSVRKRATGAAVVATIAVASAATIIAAASTAGAFDNRPAATMDGPSTARQELGSSSAPTVYAQLFGLERLFAPFTPAPRQDSKTRANRGHGKGEHRETQIRSRDRFGNPGPNYRVLSAVPGRAKTGSRGHGDSLKRRIAEVLLRAPPAPPTKGPLLLVVSIAKQTVTLYDAGVAIAKSPVSTGTKLHPTPTGIFSVVEKQWWHRSNIYSAAPMPFMQRITWTGVALHAGELPGYAASHGCIRLPESFALRLWGTTKIGARVIVTRDELAPVEIAHARLFEPKAKAAPEPLPDDKNLPDEMIWPDKQTPPANNPAPSGAAMSENVPAPPVTNRKFYPPLERGVIPANDAQALLDAPQIVTDSGDAPAADDRIEGSTSYAPPQIERGTIAVADAQSLLAAGQADADSNDEADADDAIDEETRTALQNAVLIDPERNVVNGTAKVVIARPGQPPETMLVSVEKMPDEAGQPSFESSPGVMLANLNDRSGKAIGSALPFIRVVGGAASAEPAAQQPRVLRPGPISVMISRRDKRMYVRKGFEPLFDVPVTIANPGEPIGTFIFTAVAQSEDKAKLRWMTVALDTPKVAYAETRGSDKDRPQAHERVDARTKAVAAARAALDRLDISPEAVERVSELTSIGATLIISDRGVPHREAGAVDSDFTVMLTE
jgi:hypothetical protein